MPQMLTAAEARQRLLSGEAREPLKFRGRLDLSGEKGLRSLPDGLSGDTLDSATLA